MKELEYYNPEEEYFMISVFDNDTVKHIRCPFKTKKEVDEWCAAVPTNGIYSNFQIFNEKTLDIVSKYAINDKDEEVSMTLRQAIFGVRYQKHAERFQSGKSARLTTHNNFNND